MSNRFMSGKIVTCMLILLLQNSEKDDVLVSSLQNASKNARNSSFVFVSKLLLELQLSKKNYKC